MESCADSFREAKGREEAVRFSRIGTMALFEMSVHQMLGCLVVAFPPSLVTHRAVLKGRDSLFFSVKDRPPLEDCP